MSKVQWEFDLVERHFCLQLQALEWTWLVGDVDVSELTERAGLNDFLVINQLKVELSSLYHGGFNELISQESSG